MVIFLALIVWIRPALIGFGIDAYIAKVPSFEKDKFKQWLLDITSPYVDSPTEGLVVIFSAVIVLLVVESLLQFYQTYLANWVAQSVTLDLRSKLFKHILSFKLKYFDKNPVGAFVTRLVSDIDGIADIFSNGILSVVGDLLKLTVVIVIMVVTDWKLTLIILAPIPVLLIATRIFQKAIKKAFIQVRNQVNKINVFVLE